MTLKEIENKIKEYKELQRISEEATAEMNKIKEELKCEFDRLGTDTITTNEYKITYKAVTSNRLDTTAFKKAYADLYNKFVKPSTSKRFTIA